MSFLLTAGFVQSAGFLGPLFEEPGKHMLTQRVMWRLMAHGATAAVAGGGVLWGVIALTDSYGATETRIGLAYYLLMAMQALTQAILYMLKRYGLMLATTAAGIAVAVVVHDRTDLAIHYVHWISLGTTVCLELTAAAVLLRRRAARTRGAMRLAQLPRGILLVRRAAPFAAQGFLYFAFVSVDRLVAWADGSYPLPFWFRVEYELGVDWALAGVLFALAFLELTVERFSELLVPASERFRISDVEEHNRYMTTFWARQVAMVGVLVAVGAWIAIGIALLLDRAGALGPAADYVHDSATHWAFAGGLVGYALLAVALCNSVFLISVGRIRTIPPALAPAVLVSLATGIAITSREPYYGAVGGMVAGALVYAVISAVLTRRTLRRADYWTYAAW